MDFPLARSRESRAARRLTDTAASHRRRRVAGLLLLVIGLSTLGFGAVAGRTDPPAPVQVAADGPTPVPQTRFFQSPWVLYGQVDDPRRPPSAEEVGCLPGNGWSLPTQPDDPTTFGSRVVGGVPIAAIVLYGHSGDGAVIRCSGADDHAPLWLMPSSDAPPFTATSIVILGVLLLVAAALVHPSTTDRPRLRRLKRPPRESGG
ncbi:hypothetical protein [Nocardioides sp. SYSU DS0663]|uniref:hypothetical protein n=1 Tax=Nocardioides sp. SYSU DS0663 TaxID=3416445 RepID=UPI003F4CA29F